jgi:hypothetical protein
VFRENGSRNVDPPHLLNRTDPDVVDEWIGAVVEPGHLDGNFDPRRRLEQMDRDGVAAEVIFPDFGLPFELYPPLLAAMRGYERSADHVAVGNRAYNLWLADFCGVAPHRFAGMATVSFHNIDEAVKDIRLAHDSGLKGIVLPMFDEAAPVFDVDNYNTGLLARQNGRCPLCQDHLLTPDQPPQSPHDWERWWLGTVRRAISADYLTHHEKSGRPDGNTTQLVHASCHGNLRARQRSRNRQPATPSRLA